nr:hypothetical protein [Lactobacillus delbrueckii]
MTLSPISTVYALTSITVVAYLAFLIYKQLPKRLVYFFKGTEK